MVTEHLEERDGVLYISGTRISLDSIVYAFLEGSSPESIREDFDGLSLAQVYGAIAFYLDHKAEVDSYLSRRNEQWNELERQGKSPNPELLARVERARRRGVALRQE
jgi:uncharacterized protein (DUF433 family)